MILLCPTETTFKRINICMGSQCVCFYEEQTRAVRSFNIVNNYYHNGYWRTRKCLERQLWQYCTLSATAAIGQ